MLALLGHLSLWCNRELGQKYIICNYNNNNDTKTQWQPHPDSVQSFAKMPFFMSVKTNANVASC